MGKADNIVQISFFAVCLSEEHKNPRSLMLNSQDYSLGTYLLLVEFKRNIWVTMFKRPSVNFISKFLRKLLWT